MLISSSISNLLSSHRSHANTIHLHAVYEKIEAGLHVDLEETLISPPPGCETESWLEYSFKRDIVSVPSSLNGSWVVLDTNTTNHLLQSTTPHGSTEQLQHYSSTEQSYTSLEETSYTTVLSEEVSLEELQCETNSEMESSLLTSTPKQEGSLTLAELGKETVSSSLYCIHPVCMAAWLWCSMHSAE